jgi:hypothetical protein
MSTKVTLRHEIPTTPADFVERVHWSEHYHETIHRMLDMRYQLIARDPATGVREVKTWPSTDVPAVVRKVMGDDLHFHEKGQTDAATGRYDFVVHPSRGNIVITGYQAVEPLGADKLTRIVHFEIDAKLPLGVGKVVESFVRSALQRSYDESAKLIERYLRGELG